MFDTYYQKNSFWASKVAALKWQWTLVAYLSVCKQRNVWTQTLVSTNLYNGNQNCTGYKDFHSMGVLLMLESWQVETSVTLSTKLIAEGPTRLKEEYVEGVLASPSVLESNIPSQLKGAYGQLVAAVGRLPNTVKEVLAGGVKVPLSKAPHNF